MSEYFLGIDGGGTKTEGLMCDEKGNCLYHEFGGPSNPNDIGVDNSVDVLSKMIMSAFKNTDISNADQLYIFCGISGSINRNEEMTEGLSKRFPEYKISVDSDVMNVINAELGQDEGVCIICGTGSVCFVRIDKRLIRIGGWGYLLDCGGSGFNLGRDAIESVLMAEDGRGEKTVLSDIICKRMGGKAASDCISEIYDGGKTYIASFAGCVFDGYVRNDLVCRKIIDRNAKYIADMINTANNYLKIPFCAIMNGGINTSFTEIWFSSIRKYIPDTVELKLATKAPVYGALCGAFELAGLKISYMAEKRIDNFILAEKAI